MEHRFYKWGILIYSLPFTFNTWYEIVIGIHYGMDR